jgi:hypothetical protein
MVFCLLTKRLSNPDRSRTTPEKLASKPMKIVFRRILLFLFAGASLCAGGYLIFLCFEHPSIYGVLRGGGVAVIFIGLGGYLLWDDFIKPRIWWGPDRHASAGVRVPISAEVEG